MKRRGFLQAMLAACAAPAVVRAASLMRLSPSASGLLVFGFDPASAGGDLSALVRMESGIITGIWTEKLVEKFYRATVFGELALKPYELDRYDVLDAPRLRNGKSELITVLDQGYLDCLE